MQDTRWEIKNGVFRYKIPVKVGEGFFAVFWPIVCFVCLIAFLWVATREPGKVVVVLTILEAGSFIFVTVEAIKFAILCKHGGRRVVIDAAAIEIKHGNKTTGALARSECAGVELFPAKYFHGLGSRLTRMKIYYGVRILPKSTVPSKLAVARKLQYAEAFSLAEVLAGFLGVDTSEIRDYDASKS